VLDRFLREIRAAAQLHHPNIVSAYTAFRSGESVVFAMEYIDGLDLAKMVKAKGPLPVTHSCLFVYKAALGMQHAHEQGIVHRDIKPGNLMFARKGKKAVVKVLDFGLAKATREEPGDNALTHAGQLLGTPDFISPEQCDNAPKADIRADIYSLGCTLYYLLTGDPPFQGKSLYDLLQAHHSMDAKPLNVVRDDVPLELAALVAKMMAKEPDERSQTPAEVARALLPFIRVLKTSPDHATTHGGSSRAPRPAPVQDPHATTPAGAETMAGEFFAGLNLKLDTDERPRKPLAPKRPEPRPSDGHRPPRAWAIAAAAGAAAVVLLGIILYVVTDKGTIKIELHDPAARVRVDGNEVKIENLGAPITLRAGPHKLVVVRGDEEIHTEEFIVKRGGNPALKVTLGPTARKTGAANAAANAPPAKEFTNSIGMKLVRIEPGTFTMGSTEIQDEKPPHRAGAEGRSGGWTGGAEVGWAPPTCLGHDGGVVVAVRTTSSRKTGGPFGTRSRGTDL
jgi:hypothetical protein